jgi:hypothetical protein
LEDFLESQVQRWDEIDECGVTKITPLNVGYQEFADGHQDLGCFPFFGACSLEFNAKGSLTRTEISPSLLEPCCSEHIVIL